MTLSVMEAWAGEARQRRDARTSCVNGQKTLLETWGSVLRETCREMV